GRGPHPEDPRCRPRGRTRGPAPAALTARSTHHHPRKKAIMTDIHSTSASHFDYLQDDAPNPAGVSVTDLDPQQRLIRLRTLLVPLGNHLASHPEDAYLLYDEAAS